MASTRPATRYYVILALVVVGTSVALSLFWYVPYIYSLLGFSAWALFGHLITADDDLPGGWSNPDGAHSFPWVELGAKALVFGILSLLAALSPTVRAFGA